MAGNSGAFWVNLSEARIETVKFGVSIESADCINSGRHPTRRSVIWCLRQTDAEYRTSIDAMRL